MGNAIGFSEEISTPEGRAEASSSPWFCQSPALEAVLYPEAAFPCPVGEHPGRRTLHSEARRGSLRHCGHSEVSTISKDRVAPPHRTCYREPRQRLQLQFGKGLLVPCEGE